MRYCKKTKALALILATAMVLGNAPVPVASAAKKKPVSLKKSKATLYITKTDIKTSYGKTTIKVKKSKGVKILKKTFKSKNPKTASVSKKGLVKAKKTGNTKITVTIKYKMKKKKKSQKLTFKVSVKERDSRTVIPPSVTNSGIVPNPQPTINQGIPDIPAPTKKPADPSYVTTDTIKDGQNYPGGVVIGVKPGEIIIIDNKPVQPDQTGTITITDNGHHHIEIIDKDGNSSHIDISVGDTPAPSLRPGETPKPSPSLKPGETDRPSPSLKPGETPEPSMKPGETPKPSPSLKPGETDRPSPSLKPGETPESSLKPGETPKPSPSLKPGETDRPSPSLKPGETPEPSLKPGETPKPSPSLKPGETDRPSPSLKPGETPKPPAETTKPHKHIYGAWEVVTPASCLTKGTKRRECTICSEEEIGLLSSLGGHSWGPWTASIEPFCTSAGSEYRLCDRCGEKQTRAVDALGVHEWSDWSVTKEASCTEKGTKERICDKCKQKEIVFIDPYGEHQWGEWTVSVVPNCSTTGKEERTCQRCGKKQSQNIFNIGEHVWNEWVTVTAATCEKQGLQKRTCENCNKTEQKTIPAIGSHSYGEWETVEEPGCNTAGTKQRICSVCGKKVTRKTEALGSHTWREWNIEKEATCFQKGLKSRECTNCDAKENSDIPAIGYHTFPEEWQTEREPSCDETGLLYKECEVCGVREEKETAILDHKWGDWEPCTDATCAAEGEEERTCELCGATEVRNVSGLSSNHEWGDWEEIAPALCGIEGLKRRKCSVCGKIEEEQISAYENHEWGDWEVRLEPTCVDNGAKERYCTICEKLETETIFAKGSHEYTEIHREEPKCYDTGLIEYECTVCGETNCEQIEPIGHHTYSDNPWNTTIPPLCFEMGEKERTCLVCGEIEREDIPYIGSHSFGDWTVAEPATCGSSGRKERECSLCHDTESEEVPPTDDHDFGDWTVIQEASCFDVGQKARTCRFCGATEVEDIPSFGEHVFDKGEILTEATCGSEGEMQYTCTRCGDKITEVIPITKDHTWQQTYEQIEETDYEDIKTVFHADADGWLTLQPATCGNMGYKIRICTVCGHEETADIKATRAHTWTEWNKTFDSCMEEGMQERTCTVCDLYESEVLPPIGHHTFLPGSWNVIENNSCLEDGRKERTCTICNYIEEQTIPAYGSHDFSTVYTIDKEPTCTENGTKSMHCLRDGCDATIMETEIPALGHKWGSWNINSSATCTKEGSKTRTCQVCHESETVEIEATGHTVPEHLRTSYFAPTCENEGRAIGTCSKCGAKNVEEIIPATGHSFEYYNTTEATCEDDGIREYVCINKTYDRYGNVTGICGTEDENNTTHPPIVLKALGHNFSSEWTIDEGATCQSEGRKSHHCTRCDEFRDETTIPMSDHKITSWKIIENPTCEDEGFAEGVCSMCGEIAEKSIPATGHTITNVDTLPTCEQEGSRCWICSVCGESMATGNETITKDEYIRNNRKIPEKGGTGEYIDLEIEAVGHRVNPQSASYSVKASCESEGYRVGMCIDCYHIPVTEYIPATGHKYDYYETTKATCSEPGEKTHVCINPVYDEYNQEIGICGSPSGLPSKPPITIDKVSHEYEWVTIQEATCTEDGYAESRCIYCDQINTTGTSFKILPKGSGHKINSWRTEAEATCEEPGIKVGYCENCHEMITEETDPLGHLFKSHWKDATCEEGGLMWYSCSRCGENDVSDEQHQPMPIEPKGHTVSNPTERVYATCESEGYRQGTCDVCHQNDVQQIVPVLGHLSGGYMTYIEPTCDEENGEGEERVQCMRPLYDEYHQPTGEMCLADLSSEDNPPKTLPRKTEHTWGDWYETEEGTCVTNGVKEHECTVCGKIEEAPSEKNPNNHENTIVQNTPGTCETIGTSVTTCASCGGHIGSSNTSYGHVWINGGASLACQIHGGLNEDNKDKYMNKSMFNVREASEMFLRGLVTYDKENKILTVRTYRIGNSNELSFVGTTSKMTLVKLITYMQDAKIIGKDEKPSHYISTIRITNKYNDTLTDRGSYYKRFMYDSSSGKLRAKNSDSNHCDFFHGITNSYWGNNTMNIKGMPTGKREADNSGGITYICTV